MELATLYGACAFAAGLALTLALAAYLTPRQWWRRPNARALLIMVIGAWGFGSLILHFAPAASAQPRIAAAAVSVDAGRIVMPAAIEPAPPLLAGQPFQVHRDLNLRAAAGVHAARLAIVPAGAMVTPTGARNGDWWQIRTGASGQETTGWVSSLWLRRSGE